MKTLSSLWAESRLAEKDGFLLLLSGGFRGMHWWNREHVNELVAAWKALPADRQAAFLASALEEKPGA